MARNCGYRHPSAIYECDVCEEKWREKWEIVVEPDRNSPIAWRPVWSYACNSAEVVHLAVLLRSLPCGNWIPFRTRFTENKQNKRNGVNNGIVGDALHTKYEWDIETDWNVDDTKEERQHVGRRLIRLRWLLGDIEVEILQFGYERRVRGDHSPRRRHH